MTGYESKRAAAQDKLAQPAQEPVAWMWRCKPYYDYPNWEVSLKRPADSGRDGNKKTDGYEDVPLYTAPPQPEQEPVAWAVVGDGKFGEYELGQVFVDCEATHTYWENRGYELVPVYTTPPQRPWVEPTGNELVACVGNSRQYGSRD